MMKVGSYARGVDLGTTFTAAALYRGGRAEPITLGSTGWSIPSVVHLSAQGETVCGEAAGYLGASSPERTFREFKRDFGSDAPYVTPIGPRLPDWFTARLLEHVVATSSQRERETPTTTVVTHPATWASHRLERLAQCVTDAGLDDVAYLAEPIAAATHYVALGRVAPGETVAIYDFGGGTFDASIVHHNGTRIEIVGNPKGADDIGGIDLDEIIMSMVDDGTDGLILGADIDDRAVVADLYSLRSECARCKIALSSDLRSPIRVRIGTSVADVMIERSEFERRIEPLVQRTVEVLEDAVSSAGLELSGLSRVLLVGGSSRIPLVGQMVRNAMQVPISVDIDAASAIAQGAAIHAGGERLRFHGEADHSAHLVLTPADLGRAQRFVAPGEDLGRLEQTEGSITIRAHDGRVAEIDRRTRFTIGRAPDCHLRFLDDQISRVHGTVRFDPAKGWTYIDSSTNGSFVGETSITELAVRATTLIRLGRDGPTISIAPDEPGDVELAVEVTGELVYPVEGRTSVIGRRPPADIVVEDPQLFVSTNHLEVRHDEHGWTITDVSTNGTYFSDGRRLDRSPHRLSGDAVVHLGTPDGPAVSFTFVPTARHR